MGDNIGTRVILLVAGLTIAWCAAWGGSEMSTWALTFNGPSSVFAIIGMVVLGIIAAFFGGCVVGCFVQCVICEGEDIDDAESVCAISLSAICFALLFGLIVRPFESGADIGAWVTPLDFLLVLGFLPVVFVVKDLITDISLERRERNIDSGNVTRIHDHKKKG